MQCSNCKKEVTGIKTICPYCRAKLINRIDDTAMHYPVPFFLPPSYQKKLYILPVADPRKKNSLVIFKTVIITVIFMSAFFVMILATVLQNQENGRDKSISSTSEFISESAASVLTELSETTDISIAELDVDDSVLLNEEQLSDTASKGSAYEDISGEIDKQKLNESDLAEADTSDTERKSDTSMEISSNEETRNTGKLEAVVTSYTVNLRSGPAYSYPIEGKVTRGDIITITAYENGWYYVQTEDVSGWGINDTWFEAASSSATEEPVVNTPSNEAETSKSVERSYKEVIKNTGEFEAVVTSYTVNLRSGPAYSYPIEGRVIRGDIVTITAYENGWYNVQTEDVSGWGINDTWFEAISSSETGVPGANMASNEAETSKPVESSYKEEIKNTGKLEAVVTSYTVNLRSGPAYSYPIEGKVTRGDIITITAYENGWYNAQTEDVSGWGINDTWFEKQFT